MNKQTQRQLDDLKVVLVQAEPEYGLVASNLASIEQLLSAITTADLIVLPEMFSTGFSMDSRANSEPVDGPTTAWMQNLAKVKNAVICGSICVAVADGDYRNRLLWVSPDGAVQYYDKRHLFRMAGEDKRFTQGEKQLLIEHNGWRIRPLICYDLRFPVWSRDATTTDLLLYVACWPEVRSHAWNSLLTARAIENQCFVLGVNRVGRDHNGHWHSGDSQALDFMGKPLVRISNQATAVCATLRGAELLKFREKFPAYLDAETFSIN